MAGTAAAAGKARVRRLFAARAPERPAPPPLARWASSFSGPRSSWNACTDLEWLLLRAGRACGPGEQRRQAVLCAADIAELARRGRVGADPRVTHAISLVHMWAEGKVGAADLLLAEQEALSAARESTQAAKCDAARALVLLRTAPRRRLGSFAVSRALGASQRWHEDERSGWLALAAALAVRAAALADDATVTAAEWAGALSQSVAFALRAMPARRSAGKRADRIVMRRCAWLAHAG